MRWSAPIMLFVLLGCTEIVTQDEYNRQQELRWEIILIDGCQYYTYPDDLRRGTAHKGNCKNCLKRDTCR